LKWFDGRCIGYRSRRFLQVVVYRGVVVSEQCVFMRGSCYKFPCNRFMFIGMLVLSQGRGSGRDIDCLSDSIAQGDGPNTNYPVEEVPERFRPLDNRQGLEILGVSGWSSFCLTFKALHWVSKVFITLVHWRLAAV
jgi:hypothetical protein